MLRELSPMLYEFGRTYGPYLLVMICLRTLFLVWSKMGRKSIKNQIILITGASSGIGEALAEQLYLEGAKVILASRRVSELRRVQAKLTAIDKFGLHAPAIVAMDLSDLDSIDKKVDDAWKIHGKIDVVVHNAGLLSRGEIAGSKIEVFQEVMQVNYFGVVKMTLAVLPKMLNLNSGHIVAISSVQGLMALPRRSAYAASKHALVAFMDSLRAEVSHSDIQVSCVHPGYVKTNIAHSSLKSSGEVFGQPDENIENGYSVEYVADEILKIIESGAPDFILAPPIPKLLVYLRLFCPSLHFHMMKKVAKSDQYY